MKFILYDSPSAGEGFPLTIDGLYIKEGNFHKWNYEPHTTKLPLREKLDGFTKSAAHYQTTLCLTGSRAERMNKLNKLHEAFEADVRNKTAGLLSYGQWHIECYVIASDTVPDEDTGWTFNDIDIYCPSSFWIQQKTYHFNSSISPDEGPFLGYPYDYPYDYKIGQTTEWTFRQNQSLLSSPFKLKIYGPAIRPIIWIPEGYPRGVYGNLDIKDYVEIDSRKKTVICHRGDGTEENWFDYRTKYPQFSIFDPIRGGEIKIRISSGFNFDLTLYVERSEPIWYPNSFS